MTQDIVSMCMPIGQNLLQLEPSIGESLTASEYTHPIYGQGCAFFMGESVLFAAFPDPYHEPDPIQWQMAGEKGADSIVHNFIATAGYPGPFTIIFPDGEHFHARTLTRPEYHEPASKHTGDVPLTLKGYHITASTLLAARRVISYYALKGAHK